MCRLHCYWREGSLVFGHSYNFELERVLGEKHCLLRIIDLALQLAVYLDLGVKKHRHIFHMWYTKIYRVCDN